VQLLGPALKADKRREGLGKREGMQPWSGIGSMKMKEIGRYGDSSP